MKRTKFGKLSGKVLPPQMEIHNEILERLQYIQNIQHMIEDDYFEHTIYFTRAAGPLYNQYRNMDFEVIDLYFPNQTSTFPYLRLLHVRDDPRDPNNFLEITVHITNFNMITKRRPTRFGKRK